MSFAENFTQSAQVLISFSRSKQSRRRGTLSLTNLNKNKSIADTDTQSQWATRMLPFSAIYMYLWTLVNINE